MRLLLAEDNRELAHWLEKALVQNGFAVDCVNDGRAADHLLQEKTMPSRSLISVCPASTGWRWCIA